MRYNDGILQGILDIAEGLLKNGAETYRIEESLYRMCTAYGFERINYFLIPSNIQVTVRTPDGEIITHIRHIDETSINYDNLDQLNDLCRYVCSNAPGLDELNNRIDEFKNRKSQRKRFSYLAAVLGCAGYTAFFGGGVLDTIIAIIVALIIWGIKNQLIKIESNLLLFNALLSFVAEIIILKSNGLGICPHPDSVTLGFVMLLVSGLGIINGIREYIQRDFLSGAIHIMDAVLGASGIALGILIPMLIMHDFEPVEHVGTNVLIIKMVTSFIGCVGFALIFKLKGKEIIVGSIGASLTILIYSYVHSFNHSNFMATLIASIFVGVFAFASSRLCRTPSTIFHTIAAFPLIPGSNLYFMMFNCATANMTGAMNELIILVVTCLAIAFGFNIVNVFERNYIRIQQKRKTN